MADAEVQELPDVDQLQDLLSKVNDIYEFLDHSIKLDKIFSESIEALEKQFATITMGYVEQAVILEALVSLVPEERQEQFKAYVKAQKTKVLNAIQDGNDALSRVLEDLSGSVG